ncbi:MAG: hypothetical protein KA604_02270 [Candidatus Saccharimonas sp.]|nr:hypothetical protein [Candidatus Saccharimonas sp.]
MQPRLMIHQKLTAFVNKYQIITPNPDNTPGALVALAQQKRFAFKEKVMFYTDEKRDKLAFTFRAEKVMDIHGRFFVEDANGKMLGMFKKEFAKSLLNSTWKMLDANGNEMLLVRESNQALAILRRFAGEIPLVGGIAELVLLFFKYHFVFVDLSTQQTVGVYHKTTLLRDNYALELDEATWNRLDWRVYAAMGVALDALQSR